jgi:hypothetical protein
LAHKSHKACQGGKRKIWRDMKGILEISNRKEKKKGRGKEVTVIRKLVMD